VQGECRGKSKAQDLLLALPSRSLFYVKIVQGERNGKSKAQDLLLAVAEPQPILCKDNAR